jgi:hypothetical protein
MRAIVTATLATVLLSCGSATARVDMDAGALCEAPCSYYQQAGYRMTHRRAGTMDPAIWGYRFSPEQEPPPGVGVWVWGHHLY